VSPNKKIVETYFVIDSSEYARVLADVVEIVGWDAGVSASGAVTRGKSAYVQNRGNLELQIQIEENNVVVAEGFARGSKKEGGTWARHFCDTFEIQNGKVKRISTHGVDVNEST
jgi:uncharacterized protein